MEHRLDKNEKQRGKLMYREKIKRGEFFFYASKKSYFM